jgi:uncharacterized protein YbjT (DUF2867 family)
MILVTGAGGKTGRALTRALSSAARVCAFVYRQEQVSIARSSGAKRVVVGDLRDEEAVRSAMEGVRAVYHICPNMSRDEIIIGRLAIEAARKARVEHFVFHSVLHPQTETMRHHWQKMRVEELIFESGLPFTILQPAPYMQNLLAVWKSIVEEGVLRVPYSVDSKFSFLDLEDLAEVARMVLAKPGHLNAVYELAGTSAVSHVEVAEIFASMLNRRVRAEQSEPSTRVQSKTGEYAAESLIKMFNYYDKWGLVGNPNVLTWLLDREPTSLAAFIERTSKQTQIWT